jgi:hypothetical protein
LTFRSAVTEVKSDGRDTLPCGGPFGAASIPQEAAEGALLQRGTERVDPCDDRIILLKRGHGLNRSVTERRPASTMGRPNVIADNSINNGKALAG